MADHVPPGAARPLPLDELAATLAEGSASAAHAVSVAFDGDDVELALFELPARNPLGGLIGLELGERHVAFGVVSPANAQHVGTTGKPVGGEVPVTVCLLIDRAGNEAARVHSADPERPVDLNHLSGGRASDLCRRVLGLPTAPPTVPTRQLWVRDWLDRMLAVVLATDLGERPPEWPVLAALWRGEPETTHPWAILRRECAWGTRTIADLSPADAAWMDDGVFSREALSWYPELHELVADLGQLLPAVSSLRLLSALQRLGVAAA